MGLIGRILKTDAEYLAQNGFWLLVGQCSSFVASFALAVAFANLIPKETYGSYKYLLSIAALTAIFSLTGLRTAIVQSAARGFGGSLHAGFWLSMRSGIFIVLTAFGIATYYFLQGNKVFGSAMLIAGAASPFFYSGMLYSSYLVGLKEFKRENIWGITRDLVPLLILLGTMYFTTDLVWLVAAYFIGNTGIVLYFYKKTIRDFTPNTDVDPGMLRFGTHLSGMAAMAAITGQLDKILIFQFLGPVQTALYVFGTAIPTQIQGVFKNIYTLALPKYAGREPRDLRDAIFKKLPITFLSSLAVALLYAILAPYLFKWFFPQYLDAVFYSQIFVFTIVLGAIGSLSAAYFDAQNEVRQKYVVSIVSNISKAFFMWILVMYFGVTGLMAGIFLGYLANFTVAFFFITRARGSE